MLNNNEKKTILVLTSSFPRWEGDTKSCFVYELSKRLSKEFNVIILAPHDKNCKTNETFGGCKIYRFKYAPEKFEVLAYNAGILSNLKHNRLAYLLIPFFLLHSTFQLKKILKEYNIDLIHAHWVIPQGMTAMIASYFSQKISSINNHSWWRSIFT
ncbi:glycosyltransferase [sulfur-oxidizing endosymbiont of Gigantopelta aegis]|uniref:glycosyltransferase n=1 Tax=sulfur-oxidizing endosymbiont of Gigantopelta aegis TaxID=2794934 RepID=UPI0018DC2326|nr:glycosyltransferase [sulfur-oxidizing endosymbiont of Gigantopelta aegis]